MSSSLLLQQCPACLFLLTWVVFVKGSRWPYSWCFVGCCRLDLVNIARNILVWFPSRFFFNGLVSVQVVYPYSSIDTTTAWKKLLFILSVRFDFHMIESLSIACRCLFRLMKRCFLGRWTCLLVSERFCLVWKCCLFGYSTYIQFCVQWHGGQCLRRLVPNYVVVFRLGLVYMPVTLCHRHSRRRNCFCGVPSAFFLFQLKAVFSDFVDWNSKHVV